MPLCEPRCASRRALGSPRESPRVPASIGPRRCLPRRVPRGDGVLRRHQRVASRGAAGSCAPMVGGLVRGPDRHLRPRAVGDPVLGELRYRLRRARRRTRRLGPYTSRAETFTRACQVQRELAHVAGLHHRSVKIADLVIAAAAELSGTIVWHYDENYDRVAAITGQPTEWIVPRGTL